MNEKLRLGTRGSPLALAQAELVRNKVLAIAKAMSLPIEVEIFRIKTSGDWRPQQKEQTFAELGGTKGLFTKEIEEALKDGLIHFAVHSLKDVSVFPSEGLCFPAVLERADQRDAFISADQVKFADLPAGAVVATASLRRQAQILALRPDLKVSALRGNVETRLEKIKNGEAAGTLLAVAGLSRLNLIDKITEILPENVMTPCAGQGAIGVQTRVDLPYVVELVGKLNHFETMLQVTAERAVLRVLDGSCRMPIGAFARKIEGDHMRIDAMVSRPNGTQMMRLHHTGIVETVEQAEIMGENLGAEFRLNLPKQFFAA